MSRVVKVIIFFIMTFVFTCTSLYLSVDKNSAEATVKIGKRKIADLYAFKNHKENVKELKKKYTDALVERNEWTLGSEDYKYSDKLYKSYKSNYKEYMSYYKKYKSLFKYKFSIKYEGTHKLLNNIYYFCPGFTYNYSSPKLKTGIYIDTYCFPIANFFINENYKNNEVMIYSDKKMKKKFMNVNRMTRYQFYRFRQGPSFYGGIILFYFSKNRMKKLSKILESKENKKTKTMKWYYKRVKGKTIAYKYLL